MQVYTFFSSSQYSHVQMYVHHVVAYLKMKQSKHIHPLLH